MKVTPVTPQAALIEGSSKYYLVWAHVNVQTFTVLFRLIGTFPNLPISGSFYYFLALINHPVYSSHNLEGYISVAAGGQY